MIHSNEALSYAIYMANSWNVEEAAIVFNGEDNSSSGDFQYSLGDHIWNKWIEFIDMAGIHGAAMLMLYSLDNNNLQKLLNRACELYDGRRKRND